jgi:hypothetical protein
VNAKDEILLIALQFEALSLWWRIHGADIEAVSLYWKMVSKLEEEQPNPRNN